MKQHKLGSTTRSAVLRKLSRWIYHTPEELGTKRITLEQLYSLEEVDRQMRDGAYVYRLKR